MKNKSSSGVAAKRNIVTPYNALLADIRNFIAKLKTYDNPRVFSRGTLPIKELQWLGECVRTANIIGYNVQVRVVEGKDELEFVLIERTKRPMADWRWS